MWDTIMGLLPAIMAYVPVDYISTGTSVIGGAAIIASGFAKPDSQYARKIHAVINLFGFNFGKAKNK